MTSTSKKACSTGIGSQIMEIVFMYMYIYLIEKETFPDKQGFYTWSVLSRKNLPNCCLMKPCLFASQFSKSKDQAHPKSYPSQESLFFKGRLLMAEILHRLIGSISHYLQSYIHPKWCFGIHPSTVSPTIVLEFAGLYCFALTTNHNRPAAHSSQSGEAGHMTRSRVIHRQG